MEMTNRNFWRNYLRLSLRALIASILIIGCTLGWAVRTARVQQDAVTMIQKRGGFIWYDWQYKDADYVQAKSQPPGPKWLVDRIGVDYVSISPWST
jgi:hypothetical protein